MHDYLKTFLLLGLLSIPVISRDREFEADETGAAVIGDGDPLANALIKINQSANRNPMNVNPSFSPLFIINPFGGWSGFGKWFSIHPPVEERVSRLRKM